MFPALQFDLGSLWPLTSVAALAYPSSAPSQLSALRTTCKSFVGPRTA